MEQPWEQWVETAAGSVQWQSVSDPFGGSRIWYVMVCRDFGRASELMSAPPDGKVLVGYLGIEAPTSVDEETRRPTDPHDRRIDTIWVHPRLRGNGLGAATGHPAKAHLYDIHSNTRTAAGSRWAKSVGDHPSEASIVPDEARFDSGARKCYETLLREVPDWAPVPGRRDTPRRPDRFLPKVCRRTASERQGVDLFRVPDPRSPAVVGDSRRAQFNVDAAGR